MGDYYGEEEYDYERRWRGRRPSPRRNITDIRRSQHFLDPATINGGGLYRTRSQGHAPVPIVNTYVDVQQDNNQRTPSPYPVYPVYPPSPGYYARRDNRYDDEIVDAIDNLAVETRRAGRSRSRVRSDVNIDRRDDYYDWERRRKSEEERIRKELELERMRTEEDDKKKKREIIDDYEKRKREESEDRKAEEKRVRDKIKQEEIDKKEKEKKDREEFERKKKEEEDEAKEKKKKHEEEVDEALRQRLYNMGWTKSKVDMEIERERIKRTTTTTTTTTTFGGGGGALVPLYPVNQAPTYAKVKREHIAVETLKYFGIPWEFDRDKKYIIILREMTEEETDVLFEHTKQLKEKKLPLLLEPPKERAPQYAWYRKRDRSSSRVRKAGILKYED